MVFYLFNVSFICTTPIPEGVRDYDLYDIWSRLPVPSDFDRKNKESCQLGNALRVICYEFAGPSYHNANSLSNLFTNIAGDTNLQFLKEIDLYTKI
jgi:hypothetical protein